jgi:hypothetical protein
VAGLYRRSWEQAGPKSFGRLVGMLKASILAGEAESAARYVRGEVPAPDSPASGYALALAGLVLEDDELARAGADEMLAGSEAFVRTAEAIKGLADRHDEAYTTALRGIVADFESREEHLTGVPIADTALVLERMAAARGMAVEPRSSVLPELS